MKFWRENKLGGEFEAPAVEIAGGFAYAVANDKDWREKHRQWPLERVLRDWLTSPLGLNSTWEAETGDESFEALLQAARQLARDGRLAAAGPFTVEIQWHGPEGMFAAALVRDGQPWFLDGALVGMGTTRGAAIDELTGIARYLAVHGENGLTSRPLALADREWLFALLDCGDDPNLEMRAAIQDARRRQAAQPDA